MPSANHVFALYQELANWYEQTGQAQMRDRFLVLAADAALSAGRAEQADRLRLRLLQQNPHHLLKPYGSMAEALKAPDVQNYVADLRRSYTPETAEHLLHSLRPDTGGPGPRKSPPPPPAPEPPRESPEVLKFYRVQEEPGAGLPEPLAQRQIPVTRPAPQPAPPKPAAPPPPARKSTPAPGANLPKEPPARTPPRKPARPPAPAARAKEPPPRSSLPYDQEEEDLATGYWVATLLFVLLLVAGLALAGYTFARPFLPAEWFN
jgi:hypothetical protein